jgi:hypothetical protein
LRGAHRARARDPRWVHRSATPDPTSESWLVLGVRRPSVRRLGGRVLCLGSQRSPRGCRGASLSVAMAASGHVSSTDTLSRGLKAHGSSCLVEELWRALPCRPTLFGRWDVGATWSRFGGEGAVALGARGSRPLMVASGPEGSQISSGPARRRVLSGRCAW